jgi:hypothetical protein
MLDNVNYNLLETITIISKSLYRYESYVKDAKAADCRSCQELWRKMAAQREAELAMLLTELKAHMGRGELNIKEE